MRSPLRLEVLEDRSVPAMLLTVGTDPSQFYVTGSGDGLAMTFLVTANPSWVVQVVGALQTSAAALDAVAAATGNTVVSVAPSLIDPSAPPPAASDFYTDPSVVNSFKALLAPLAGPYGDFIRSWN